MKSAAPVLIAALVASLGAPAFAQDRAIRDLTLNMRDIVKHSARSDIERGVRDVTRGQHTVTSRDRTGALQSRAHDRGAIDFVSPRTGTAAQHSEARAVSQRLGPHYTTVVEETNRPGRAGYSGPAHDRHTAYANGNQGNVRVVAPRASGTHTHVQPNYGINVPRSWERSGTGPTTPSASSPGVRSAR